MITLTEHIAVARPREEVFRYVSDFRSIAEWDPGVVAAWKITPGKVGVGTEYGLNLRYGLFPVSMTYKIVEYEVPRKVVLEGRGESFSARDTIVFSQRGAGETGIDYSATLRFGGLGAKIAPLFSRLLQRIGRNAVAGLKNALDQYPPAPAITLGDAWLDRSIVGGLPGFTRWGFQRSRRHWKPVPASLAGKTVLVTGATSGIGLAAATGLADRGARVLLVARRAEKAAAAADQIMGLTGNDNLEIYPADMAVPGQVRALAAAVRRREHRLDVLVNNAGALFHKRENTADGLEKTLATDLLGPFILTEELAPLLAESAPARVINVSSGGMYTQKIRVDDLAFRREPYDGAKAYARAKRGLVILSEIWAGSYADQGIVVHAMHPGWVKTPGIKRALPEFYRIMDRLLRTPEQGADTIIWLAVAPEAAKTTGRFWLDRRPHLTHVFPHTRETESERQFLYRELARLAREV
ncbi:MAG: SDR family NAD(P)-dependent oxidoreductase [Thermodesulfobacteriota bacterium]